MIKKFQIILLVTSFAFADEVSVFGAGDLNSKNPYGLSKTEKAIVENKQTIDSVDTKIKKVTSSVSKLGSRIDGIESIYEGDSQKLNSAVIKLNKNITDIENNSKLIEVNKEDIKNIKLVTNQLLTLQEQQSQEVKKNIDSLKEALEKITKLVNEINSNYMSVAEFKKNLKEIDNKEQTKTPKNSSSSTQNEFEGKKKSDLLSEAQAFYKRDYFTNAIPIFEYLLENNYRPALSSYYLGEMWYYRKKYEDAISYFKKSATLYQKAEYMPVLMLHSAISFEKLGDIENASNFYSSLISLYPDSKEAKIASKNILDLK